MSGQIGNNILRTSGVVAATAAGLNWVSTVVTASTLTAEAGNGYFINTTSNTCTITLPSSAEAGDQIVFMDYLRTWGTNKIIIDSNGLNYQGDPDTFTVEYDTTGETVNIVYSGATNGWIPLDDDVVALAAAKGTQKAIFGFGTVGPSAAGVTATTNLVSSVGVVSADVSGIGTARYVLSGAGYGGDKAIFAFGDVGPGKTAISNLVSNSGVVASDTAGVGTTRYGMGAATYGTDKAIYAFGTTGGGTNVSMSNLVSNSGVVAADVTGVGTARRYLAATNYGGTSTAIFAYGYTSSHVAISNLVNSSGVVATDTSGIAGTVREGLGAAGYGYDKAIFGYGSDSSAPYDLSMTNLVNSSGVIATDVTGVGTARGGTSASTYGGDKAIFAYGLVGATGGALSMSNLVNNVGVVGSDVTGVGTSKYYLASAEYSTSA